MVYVLHIVPRWDKQHPQLLAESVLTRSSASRPVRLLELFESGPDHQALDLSLSAEDTPELMAVLQDASEVHVHNIHLKTVLRRLPYVVPEVLAKTTLFLHGPWGAPFAEYPGERMHLSNWPGPVRSDFPAGELPEGVTPQPISRQMFYDLADSCLLPRDCQDVLLHDGERAWFRVLLYPHLDEAVKTVLAQALPELGTEQVQVEVVSPGLNDQREFLQIQRSCQLVILRADLREDPRPLALVHALLQHVPVLLVGECGDEQLPACVHTLPAEIMEQPQLFAQECRNVLSPRLVHGTSTQDWAAVDAWLAA